MGHLAAAGRPAVLHCGRRHQPPLLGAASRRRRLPPPPGAAPRRPGAGVRGHLDGGPAAAGPRSRPRGRRRRGRPLPRPAAVVPRGVRAGHDGGAVDQSLGGPPRPDGVGVAGGDRRRRRRPLEPPPRSRVAQPPPGLGLPPPARLPPPRDARRRDAPDPAAGRGLAGGRPGTRSGGPVLHRAHDPRRRPRALQPLATHARDRAVRHRTGAGRGGGLAGAPPRALPRPRLPRRRRVRRARRRRVPLAHPGDDGGCRPGLAPRCRAPAVRRRMVGAAPDGVRGRPRGGAPAGRAGGSCRRRCPCPRRDVGAAVRARARACWP